MQLTFDNIEEKVIKNRTISRKEKLHELKKFLKQYGKGNKPSCEKEIAVLETLKNMKDMYVTQELNEKKKDKEVRVF